MKRLTAPWAVLLLSCCGLPQAAAQVPDDGPSFRLLRANEDYSALAGESGALGGWRRIKFAPLSTDRSVWASFGGEFRGRYEGYENDAWGDGPQDGNGFFSLRTLLHADLHANQHVRLFGQIQTGAIAGRNGGPRPPDRDDADLHQLFIGFKSSPIGSTVLDLRIGRQEVQYGSGCLISVREGAGTRRSFEGATLAITDGAASLSAFWLRPVRQLPGSWDNSVHADRSLAGMFLTVPRTQASSTSTLDVYLVGSRQDNSAFAGVHGLEQRITVGARGAYADQSLDATLEVAAQRGRQGDQNIRAWFTASEVGWTLRNAPLTPRLSLRAGVASGDADASDGRVGTFNALYPNLSYFGEIALLGPANLIDLHPKVTLNLAERLSLTFGAVAYWRHRVADGIYGASLASERPASATRARKVGNQWDAKLVWSGSNQHEVTLGYAVFRPGAFLRETGSSETVRYLNIEAAWRF